MNMTTENAERAQNSTQRLAHFKAERQTEAKSFLPVYRDLLNTLEIKQLEEILQIGEATGFLFESIYLIIIIIYYFDLLNNNCETQEKTACFRRVV